MSGAQAQGAGIAGWLLLAEIWLEGSDFWNFELSADTNWYFRRLREPPRDGSQQIRQARQSDASPKGSRFPDSPFFDSILEGLGYKLICLMTWNHTLQTYPNATANDLTKSRPSDSTLAAMGIEMGLDQVIYSPDLKSRQRLANWRTQVLTAKRRELAHAYGENEVGLDLNPTLSFFDAGFKSFVDDFMTPENIYMVFQPQEILSNYVTARGCNQLTAVTKRLDLGTKRLSRCNFTCHGVILATSLDADPYEEQEAEEAEEELVEVMLERKRSDDDENGEDESEEDLIKEYCFIKLGFHSFLVTFDLYPSPLFGLYPLSIP
ncbi:hypothetical protein BOTBODRAFT_172174 [Botryobasidium botryosum FD-172 SS1]|uniref:Uncharacterized protein n=1 Tax=Botryobasidium botryosum (strain FD-172 SS1) TaxID=930990 RepID=A0A067N1U3_BOTB1|nr:hypothetical protein BOTBODRAFT_172174 [Botryobasidium botryosum FD-172 SS1]